MWQAAQRRSELSLGGSSGGDCPSLLEGGRRGSPGAAALCSPGGRSRLGEQGEDRRLRHAVFQGPSPLPSREPPSC